MFYTLRTFLETREAYIELPDYKSPTFKIHIGVPQGRFLSPLLFITYLNDFLDTEPCHFKFADVGAILLKGSDTEDLVSKLRHSCRNIENWCKQWRMGVNGSKTELILMNAERAGRFSRHATLNSLIKHTLGSLDLPSMLERRGLYRTDGKRPDGVTMISWEMGKQLVVDVTVVDALAPSRLNQGSLCNPGTTASEAEERKIE